MAEEEARIKAEFKKAAKKDDSDSDDFMVKKKGTEDIEPLAAPSASKKQFNTLNLQSDKDVLQQIYGGDDSNIDNTDKFLRSYIFSEGWKDKKQDDHYQKYQAKNEKVDAEDSERDVEMDVYE